jgi:hypothetical protein
LEVGEKGERDNAARGVACGVESAAAARAAIAAAQDELERIPVAGSLGALVCKLGMDVCESELPGEVDVDNTGWAMVRCDCNGAGIDAIRLGEVRKCSREADRENLSGKGRVFRSISMLAFP